MPGWFVAYFHRAALALDDPSDYADPSARLVNARNYSWMHTLGEVVTSIIGAGMDLRWLHEHDRVPWRMFELLVEDARRHVPLAGRALAAAGVLAERRAARLVAESW